MVWTVSAGHSCLASQANSRCPSCTFLLITAPAGHSYLLPSHTWQPRSGASQELRPQQAPSSQQANAPLNYCCLAVFSRFQSRESAERIAIRGAPSPRPTMLRGGAGTSPHPPAPIQRSSAPACPADPSAHPTTATHDGDAEGGARPAAGAGAGGDPGSGPEAARTLYAARPPGKPELFYHPKLKLCTH